MKPIQFNNVALFPKKSSFFGLTLTIVLIIISSILISTMWSTLKEIEETHFPAVERSAINVRLINLVNYQFDLALKTQNEKVVEDLKLNFDSLVQNYNALPMDQGGKNAQTQKLFSEGQTLINFLREKNWGQAFELANKIKFKERIEDFSFLIFDHTEEMAKQRDQKSQQIESFIQKTLIFSFFIFVFMIYTLIRIYKGYAFNLRERLFAEAKAKQLSRQRKSLIHVLCHDLGNPVSAIFGLIDVAHILPEKEKAGMLNEIKENAKISLDIIELTRKMQALESGKISLDLNPILFHEAIEKSLIILKERLESKKIDLQLNYQKDLKVIADETSLVNSILNNILTNSIKFSSHQAKIEITSEVKEDQTLITIRDYGIGMSEELLQNVFDETAETSRKGTDGEEGTGFGMPLVKKFIEAYGGQIQMLSSTAPEDHGTTTILTFQNEK